MTDPDTNQIETTSGEGAFGFIAVSGNSEELLLQYHVHTNPDRIDQWRGELIFLTAANALRLAAELTAVITSERPTEDEPDDDEQDDDQ